jgi:heme-degrading monooxygenase HmoA
MAQSVPDDTEVVVLWKFRVRRGAQRAFERLYGPAGAWVRLFRKAPGYLGTELRRVTGRERAYVIADRWATRDAHERFLTAFREAYEALDRRCALLTESERYIATIPRGPALLGSATTD